MTANTSPAVPTPVPPAADVDALVAHARAESERLGTAVDERLGTLDELAVTQHPEVYAELHTTLTEHLRGTER